MKFDIDRQPSFKKLQQAVDWLAKTCHETLDLQQTLQHLVQHKIIPQDVGGQVVIAYSQNQIKGVILLRPHHSELLLEACDALTTQTLFKAIDCQIPPQRVFISGQVKSWIRPQLLLEG